MLARLFFKRPSKQEGESPFWISFSDLMSALMVLFLVVMAVTLVSVTESVTTKVAKETLREQSISRVMDLIKQQSESKRVKVDARTYRIDLGEVVRFDSNDYSIKADAARFLRDYVPVLLHASESDDGKEWMKRVVVEGFTDEDGTYLHNLRLSLDRSRSVVCTLFGKGFADEKPLSEAQLRQIQQLFLVGGYSSNSIKQDKAASRRVELRIEFWGIDEDKALSGAGPKQGFGQC